MKQWKLWLGAIAVAAVQQLVLPLPAVEAGPVLFTVCGQSASGDRNAALQDAQKRAVRKALLQYLNVDSPKFQELSGRYREFVASPQVWESTAATIFVIFILISTFLLIRSDLF